MDLLSKATGALEVLRVASLGVTRGHDFLEGGLQKNALAVVVYRLSSGCLNVTEPWPKMA